MTVPFVTFEVAGLPVAKGRPKFRNVRTHAGAEFVQTYTPKKTRHYEADVKVFAALAMAGKVPRTSALRLDMIVYLPIPASWPKYRQKAARAGLVWPTKKPDLDNLGKAVTDACNGIVYADDAQLCEVMKIKRYAERPRVWMSFTILGEAV
jgi:Holliday junction resolvase RusA-like endonuclease